MRRNASFEDAGLAPLTRYWFAVAAVDSGGNRSPRSPWLVASTTPAAVPGWPAALAAPTSASVTLADLDGDARIEVIVGADQLYVFRADGTEWMDGDQSPATLGVFSTLLHNIASSPAVADVDLDGSPDIIAASWNDSLVAVFHSNGTLLPGWPKKGSAPFWSSPAVGDLDADGDPDIVIGSNAGRLYAWRADGTEVRDGDSNPATDGVYFVPTGSVFSSPAVADLNGDGLREVVFGSSGGRVYALRNGTALPGWPLVASGLMSSSPAVGDVLPGAGSVAGLEVAMASSNDSLYLLTSAGQRAPRLAAAARADHRQRARDVARAGAAAAPPRRQRAPRDHRRRRRERGAYDGSGAILPGWGAVSIGMATEASPAVADLDGDGSLEVLIGGEDRRLHAFHFDGSPVSGFPIEIGAEARSTPAIWDLDGDGATRDRAERVGRPGALWRYPAPSRRRGWPGPCSTTTTGTPAWPRSRCSRRPIHRRFPPRIRRRRRAPRSGRTGRIPSIRPP